jgi:hypothetical protein
METKHILIFLAVIIVLVGALAFFAGGSSTSVLASQYDMPAFAQCLKDNNATFYGAFWCPHCAATKKLFGTEAVKKLPYVECSTPDGRGQLPVCTDKKIESYPTWEFADGSRMGGELATSIDVPEPGKVTLRQLANAANCPIIPLDGSAPIQPVLASPVATTTAPVATSTATTSKAR